MNLVELLLKQFGGETLGQLAGLVGGGTADVEKAIKAAIPTLLAGLTGLTSTPTGTDKLINSLKSVELDKIDLDSVLKGGSSKVEEVSKTGTSMLEGLLGKGALVALLAALGKYLGNSGVITKLLPLLAPLAMSMISKQMKTSGLDIGGLAKILLGQKSNILGAMPAGLGDALKGVQGLGELGNLLGSAGNAASAAGKAAVQQVEEAASPLGKLLPIALVLGLLAFGAWYLFGRGEDPKKAVDNGTKAIEDAGKKALESVKETTEEAADKVSEVAEKAGDMLGEAGNKVMGNVKSFFTDITGALEGVKDADTATAAAPKLEEMHGSLESILEGVKALPETAQPLISEFIKGAQKTLQDKVEEVLALPGVSEILKPILDKVSETLGGFLKA